jgi:hypothetical protein
MRAYARFLAATNELAAASIELRPSLSRRGRIELTGAVLRLGELDREVCRALATPDEQRLEAAAAVLTRARAALAHAAREASVDARRRRSLSPV